MMTKYKQIANILLCSLIAVICCSVFVLGSNNKLNTYPQVLSNAVDLLMARDRIIKTNKKIENIPNMSAARISTVAEDNFVLKNLDKWLKTVKDLQNIIDTDNSGLYSDEMILLTSMLWISISQADSRYCKDAIAICERGLSGYAIVKLDKDTLKNLSRSQSIALLLVDSRIENYRYDFSNYYKRMILTEYFKMKDIKGAEARLKQFESNKHSHPDFDDLSRYVSLYKRVVQGSNPK